MVKTQKQVKQWQVSVIELDDDPMHVYVGESVCGEQRKDIMI